MNSKNFKNGRFSMTVYEDFDENNISALFLIFYLNLLYFNLAVYNIFGF